MSGSEFHIRRMRREELDLAMEWAHHEGWNPGLYDASVFYQADPSGFWAGVDHEEIVTILSGVKYDDNFGFMGLHLTRPDRRGMGFEDEIWERVHEQMRPKVLGLHTSGDMRFYYEKTGYKTSCRHIRHEGVSRDYGQPDAHVVDVHHIPFDRLDRFDTETFASRRTRFLRSWISRPSTYGSGYLYDGDVKGYGIIRPCRVGWKIGPLFATSDQIADKLYQSLVSEVPPGEPVFLDVPESSAGGMKLADTHKMTPILESLRMYKNNDPHIPVERWFGVTSFELG